MGIHSRRSKQSESERLSPGIRFESLDSALPEALLRSAWLEVHFLEADASSPGSAAGIKQGNRCNALHQGLANNLPPINIGHGYAAKF